MISMVRIDDRLIHGQVAVRWSKELGISRIIVVSDTIATNEIQKSALQMAAPSGVKAAIMPLAKAAKTLNDPRAKNLKILVLSNELKYITDLLPLLNDKNPRLNIANYGRIGGALSDKQKITDTVYLTNDDKKRLEPLFANGQDFTYQPLPEDEPQSLKTLIGGN
ncbi:PTS system mannose/fructose/N-acetylgalactosamine-transporter subunit IIB [Lacticaseibacillus jixiensis]|uniref:PTS system mannose/fructose/N-acetylgalactosamine-transporter subunit IIB n=1 Tax=Lacticaseibacillus jixiensis TaxID=3231926 RepID=UPI0036F4100C